MTSSQLDGNLLITFL